MKSIALALVGTLLMAGLSLAAPKDQTYTGEIMDSKCAGQGSHNQVMTKEGVKTAKDCTLLCMKDGGKFVLYTADAKTSFNLDDQDKPREYAGQKVTIVGTYNGETKTIHIQSIMVAP